VVVSYLEVYNESVYDLLDDSAKRTALKLADRGGKVEARGLSKREIHSAEEGRCGWPACFQHTM